MSPEDLGLRPAKLPTETGFEMSNCFVVLDPKNKLQHVGRHVELWCERTTTATERYLSEVRSCRQGMGEEMARWAANAFRESAALKPNSMPLVADLVQKKLEFEAKSRDVKEEKKEKKAHRQEKEERSVVCTPALF